MGSVRMYFALECFISNVLLDYFQSLHYYCVHRQHEVHSTCGDQFAMSAVCTDNMRYTALEVISLYPRDTTDTFLDSAKA